MEDKKESWTAKYQSSESRPQRVELSEEEKTKKLNSSINLIKALQNEIELGNYSDNDEILSGLKTIEKYLEGIKNGYMTL